MIYFHGGPATKGEPHSRASAGDGRELSVLLGPLDGYRHGVIPVPVRIYNLTLDRCLIESHEPEQHNGQRMQLEIALPEENWICVDAEVSNIREGYGYVAYFVNVPPDTHRLIERAIRAYSQKLIHTRDEIERDEIVTR